MKLARACFSFAVLLAMSPAPRAEENPLRALRADSAPARTDDVKRIPGTKSARLADIEQEIDERHQRVIQLGRQYLRSRRVGAFALASDAARVYAHVDRVARVRKQLVSDMAAGELLELERTRVRAEIARAGEDQSKLASQAALMGQGEGEARRGESFEAAFATGGFQPVGESAMASPFAKARGQLLAPVATTDPPRAVRREGAGGPGLEFRATRGAPVRAAFPGKVAFSDHFGAYGRMVIIEHGDHYYTVYGDLGSVKVRVGDEIAAGGELGAIKDEGKPVVYVEVRHRTETIDPSPWFGE